MITIHKFPLKRQFSQILEIPGGMIEQGDKGPMKVAMQGGNIYLWKLVETDNPTLKLEIRTYGTGHEIDFRDLISFTFLDTVIDGIYVWHLYARKIDE